MDGGLLSLRWNDHGQTFFSMLSSVRKRGAYTDVTLACDGRFYPAHRLVLSTCSDFFDQMFERTTCKHPVIVVANVGYGDLEALLNYMYLGEINVLQGDLSALMKAAEALRIKGLAEPTSSAASEPELKEGKRLHEDEVVGNKRKKMEEVPPMRQLAISKPAISKPATSKPATSKPAMSKPVTSNAEGTPCNQLDSSSRSRPNSQAPVGGGWPRIKGGVRPSEPPASSTGEQSKQMTPETDTASALYNTDQDHTPNPPSPEMKMEEVSVKDEPTSWYSENDSEPVKYPDSNTNLEYGSGDTSAAVDYQGGGGGSAAWNVLQTQLESHLLHGQPGTSTMTGYQGQEEPGWLEKKHMGGRRKKLTDEERQKLFAISRANPDYSSEVLRNIIISEFDLNISSRTIRRELIYAGLKTQRPRTTAVFPHAITNTMMDVQEVQFQASDPSDMQPTTIQPNTTNPHTKPPNTMPSPTLAMLPNTSSP